MLPQESATAFNHAPHIPGCQRTGMARTITLVTLAHSHVRSPAAMSLKITRGTVCPRGRAQASAGEARRTACDTGIHLESEPYDD